MKNITLRIILITLTMTGGNYVLRSQPLYKINNSKDIDMKLSGTSTLHKWAMDAKTFEGQAQFIFAAGSDSKLTAIKSLTFSLEVENLKSDEKALNKNAYKALKTDEYKDIVYKLTTASIVSEKESKYRIKAEGNLTIAGVTKPVAMDVYCMVNKDATITCSGSEKLKMTDYQVKPPTFMLGAMKTGDEITLDYTLVYKK